MQPFKSSSHVWALDLAHGLWAYEEEVFGGSGVTKKRENRPWWRSLKILFIYLWYSEGRALLWQIFQEECLFPVLPLWLLVFPYPTIKMQIYYYWNNLYVQIIPQKNNFIANVSRLGNFIQNKKMREFCIFIF